MKKTKIAILSLMLLSITFTCVSFVFLAETIPTHFGINGLPDQYGSKYFILIFPALIVVLGLTMMLVAKYGKVSDNYKKYLLFTCLIVESIFVALNVLFIVIALTLNEGNPTFDYSKILLILMGLLFIIMGNFMPKIEKNRTLGFKTKWSMYNEVTWQKTHRFTGFVGVIIGVLTIISGILFKEIVNFIILMSLIAIFAVSTTVASYYYYKQEIAKEQ